MDGYIVKVRDPDHGAVVLFRANKNSPDFAVVAPCADGTQLPRITITAAEPPFGDMPQEDIPETLAYMILEAQLMLDCEGKKPTLNSYCSIENELLRRQFIEALAFELPEEEEDLNPVIEYTLICPLPAALSHDHLLLT